MIPGIPGILLCEATIVTAMNNYVQTTSEVLFHALRFAAHDTNNRLGKTHGETLRNRKMDIFRVGYDIYTASYCLYER